MERDKLNIEIHAYMFLMLLNNLLINKALFKCQTLSKLCTAQQYI